MYRLIDTEDEKELSNIRRWHEKNYRGHGMPGALAQRHVGFLLQRLDMMKVRYEKRLEELDNEGRSELAKDRKIHSYRSQQL